MKLLFFLLVLAAAGALAWMLFLPLVLTNRVASRTGFPTEVEEVYVNPFSGVARLKGLQIENPEGFREAAAEPEFLALPYFATDIELTSLWSDRLVVDRLVVNVEEVNVVRNADGATNIDLFRTRLMPPPAEERPAAPARPFLVRELIFRLDRVVIADYSRRAPRLQTFDLNINRQFENVTDVKEILTPLVADLSAAGLTNLAESILGLAVPAPLRNILNDILSGGGLRQEGGDQPGGAVKNIFDALEERLKK